MLASGQDINPSDLFDLQQTHTLTHTPVASRSLPLVPLFCDANLCEMLQNV